MHPSIHAAGERGLKPAIIDAATGTETSYAQLDSASNRVARQWRAMGLAAGDVVAILAENHPGFYALAWGAQRAGLFYVCVSTRLTAAEVAYIIADSGAKAVVADAALAPLLADSRDGAQRFATRCDGRPPEGWADWDTAVAAMPDAPIADERAGTDMLYSSGTTGRPKGVRVALPEDPSIAAMNPLVMIAGACGLSGDDVYLSPAPLYHAAPLRWSMTLQRMGATVVLMDHFDAEAALAVIERYRCTASQFVPTHFVRMLKLPDDRRLAHDISSMRVAIHAAAPCPIPVKRAMIDWWGPVLVEYYAGSEGNGLTLVGSKDWLERPGTVGRAIHGIAHICDEDGNELPPRTEGLVYFEGGTAFSYHNDPAKTAEAANRHGWTTLGDIGWMDEDGYLYLTDRKSFMIISGGVNVYPQEIENHLVTHPAVADVAVVGGPHADMGEEVIAVVEPTDPSRAGDALRAELQSWCRTALSGVKLPRRIDFVDALPRHPTGKLYKRLLRDRYWDAANRDKDL